MIMDLGIRKKLAVQRSGIPLKPKYGLTPISCHAVLERSTCAPFIKERRMECINATSLRGKSGQVGDHSTRRTFVCRPYRNDGAGLGAGAGGAGGRGTPSSCAWNSMIFWSIG